MSAKLPVPAGSGPQFVAQGSHEVRAKITSEARAVARLVGHAPGVGLRVDVMDLDLSQPIEWGFAELGPGCGCDGGDECFAQCITSPPGARGLLVEITGGSAAGWVLVAKSTEPATVELVVTALPIGAPCAAPVVRQGPAAN